MPMEAARGAVTNAVMQRDWYEGGASGTPPGSRTARSRSLAVDCFVTVTFRRNPEGRLVAQENDGGELPRGVAEEGERAAREVVVGNPVWEEVAVEVLSFYGLYRPGIVALAEKERRQCVDELVRERPEFDRHPQYSIALVVAQRGLPTVGHRVSVAGTAESKRMWAEQSASPGVGSSRPPSSSGRNGGRC